MTIEIRDEKRTKVEATSADLTVGVLSDFLSECREAQLPRETWVLIRFFTEAQPPYYDLHAEHVVKLPTEVSAA